MKKAMVLSIICFAILFAAGLYYYLTSPLFSVEGDCTHLYYKNWSGVFIHQPRDCGFIGCFGPDLDFLRYERLWGASPATFRIIHCGGNTGDVLATDKNSVFYGGKKVTDGDSGSIEVVTSGAVTYVKDKNNIYLHGSISRNKEEWEGLFLNQVFLLRKDGLYIADNTAKPTKLELPDYQTFKLIGYQRVNNKTYIAEDKNFYFEPNGGSFLVDPKHETKNFVKLGCGYYKFEDRIFYSLYEIRGADLATFKVLRSSDKEPDLLDRCSVQYAIDNEHRWQFQILVRPGDKLRNDQIDSLLKLPINQ